MKVKLDKEGGAVVVQLAKGAPVVAKTLISAKKDDPTFPRIEVDLDADGFVAEVRVSGEPVVELFAEFVEAKDA